MKIIRKKNTGFLRTLILLTLFAIALPVQLEAQVGLALPQPPQTVQLFEPDRQGIGNFMIDSTLFQVKPPKFKREVKMDSSATRISVSEKMDETEFLLPAVVDLEYYVRQRLEFDRRSLWRKTFTEKVLQQKQIESGAIELEIPIRIKNETFTRIFGSDKVGLRVTGNISFDLSGRAEKRSGAATSAAQDRNNFSPRFNQTQQFTIEGKIGEKVTVSVEQNSEATFDFENTLKLKYEGEDDEIIQSIEAGNIGLSLPSTKYVIFGGSNKGLFGIKANMRVGDFYFTSIASLEKGEQQKLSLSGSSSESKTTVFDYNFVRNRYFFIDTYYRNYYENGFDEDLSNWFFESESRLIRKIDVYKTASYSDSDARVGIAVINPNDPQWAGVDGTNVESVDPVPGEVERATFAPLEEGRDYEYDYARGFFWLKQEIRDNEILAIAYETDQGKVGTLLEDIADTTGGAQNKIFKLRLIKPQSMQPSYSNTWPLMMRNIYSLGGTNIEKEGFDLRLEFNLNGEHETIQQNGAPEDEVKSFLYLLGLDRKDENGGATTEGDKKIDDNPFLINRSDGILMFPGLQPFDPLAESRFQLADTNRVRIYNTNNNNERLERTKFQMIVTSRSTKSTFDLGFNVLEGSEEVFLNGAKLRRDNDYIIDYFTGQLTLISDQAKRSSSNIEIKYEKATIFQLDKKTILGARAEYRFWEDSFIGLTALYMNKSTLDQRVRVGQEPFQNLVWDINTALKFKPRFLTRLVDAIPLVETNEPSSIQIEAEFAQVLPDPNTLNNSATGDDNGVAYIDDFESAKRTTTLGIRYLVWTKASPPRKLPFISNLAIQDTTVDRKRGQMVWFNPYNQVLIKDIWPNRDVNSQTGQTTDVLALQAWTEEGQTSDSSWAGIMRSTSSFANQEQTKFLEMWVKGDTLNPVRIHVDIGQISEDWHMKAVNPATGGTYYGAPSWRGLNTEDKNKNGVLDENEDTGVDGIPNGSPGDDPYDNWREPDRNSGLYDGVNGTEGNSRARGASYPDTEDLDGNGQVNLVNEYFTFDFTLDPNDAESAQFITGSTSKGWKQFRIPMKEFLKNRVGEPDSSFQSIYFVRLWLSDLTTERKTLYIATFDFVGNEWEEEGIAENDSALFARNDSLFTLTVYNTEENAVEIPGGPEPYHSPPGVSGVRDRITRALSKEQALVMRFEDIQPGWRAEARKTLYGDILTLENYKRLRMFVHGDQSLPANPGIDSSQIRLYVKMGSDKNNYYEYGQDVYAHWYSDNAIDIDIDEMTRTKFVDEKFKEILGVPGGYYRVIGNPSIQTIRYFRVGIKNRDEIRPFSGEIWLDEMRLTDVRRESGTALRVQTKIEAADLLKFNAEWESKDADFHDVKTQFGGGNTTESQNYSGVLNLDKFLPDDWNLSMPVDGRASFNRSIPKYFPKTDVLTGYNNNTIQKKLESLFGLRKLDQELEDQITINEVYGFGTTIKKRGRSNEWYLKYTVDQLTYDFDWSYKNSSNYETDFNKQTQYRQSVSYSVPWARDNFFEPFDYFKDTPVLSELAAQKLYYAPEQTSMNFNVSDTKQKQKLRRDTEPTNTVNTNTTRSFKLGYRFVPSVLFTYNRTHKTDADFAGIKGKDLLKSILTKFDFGRETDIDQGFQMDYKPNIVRWLTTNYSYSANFRYYYSNLAKNQKQSSSNVARRVSASFSPSQIANMIYSPTPDKPTGGSRGRPRRRTPPRTQQQDEDADKDKAKEDGQQEEDTDQEEGKSKKPAIKFPNPLLWVYYFFDGWQNIQTSYTWTQNVTNSYVSAIPDWKYQFGLTSNTGVPQDTAFTQYIIGPAVTDNRNLRTSMTYDISKNIKATFNHEYSVQETKSDQAHTGNESISFLAWGEDPSADFQGLAGDVRRLVPDWSIKISGVEDFLFFKDIAKSVSMEHSRSGKYTESKRLVNSELVPSSQSFNHNFQPLVGVNINWEWGMTTSIRLNQSSTFNFNKGGGATKSLNNSFTVSASYATSGGFSIPIPIWPFEGNSFKNEINFTLTFDQSTNQTFQKQFDQTEFQENQSNSSWKLRPSATYRFNTRVSGSLFYETGVTNNKISGEYSWNEFGITVNIAIRD